MLKVEPLENHSWQKTSFLDFFEPFFPNTHNQCCNSWKYCFSNAKSSSCFCIIKPFTLIFLLLLLPPMKYVNSKRKNYSKTFYSWKYLANPKKFLESIIMGSKQKHSNICMIIKLSLVSQYHFSIHILSFLTFLLHL